MPSGVFKPYSGVSSAILVFTKTDAGGTDDVWRYNMEGDGFTLDDKRDPDEMHDDIPDILSRWRNLDAERDRARTEKELPCSQERDCGERLRLSASISTPKPSTSAWNTRQPRSSP